MLQSIGSQRVRHDWATELNRRRESESEVAHLCLTLCDPTDCSPPGSSIHRIFQATILEQVAISFSRGSSQARDQTSVSHVAGRLFTTWATRETTYKNTRYPVKCKFQIIISISAWDVLILKIIIHAYSKFRFDRIPEFYVATLFIIWPWKQNWLRNLWGPLF